MSENNARYWLGKTKEEHHSWGIKASKKTKELQSKIAKDRFSIKENNPMFGKNHSEETKALFRLQRVGRNANCNNPKAVKVIDKVTKEIWCSLKEASSKNNIKYDTLKKYLLGKLKNKTNLEYLDKYENSSKSRTVRHSE